MKKHLATLAHNATALLATGLIGIITATAADAPAPAGTADQQGGNRGNRGDRGNFQQRGGGGGGGGGFTGRGGFGGLGLDEKQLELYREASEQNRDALSKLDEKLRAAQKELLQAVIAEKYDEPVVSQKAEIVAKIQTEMTMLRAKALSTVAPTLKPEQREQLESSRIGAAMLTSGGMGGFGGGVGGFGGGAGGFGGGPGGPGGDATGTGGFRGRGGNQGAPPGSEDITGGQGGPRRNRDRGGQPPTAPPVEPAAPQK